MGTKLMGMVSKMRTSNEPQASKPLGTRSHLPRTTGIDLGIGHRGSLSKGQLDELHNVDNFPRLVLPLGRWAIEAFISALATKGDTRPCIQRMDA